MKKSFSLGNVTTYYDSDNVTVYPMNFKGVIMAKEVVKEEKVKGECAEVHFGQSIPLGKTGVYSSLNQKHPPHAGKLETKMIYKEKEGVEFVFDGLDCLVPLSVIKLIIFA